MKDLCFLSVSGFFYSGSSAVVDLIKEYDCVQSIKTELRLINDPYGLIQLERSLTTDWNWIRAAMAIDDFLEFAKKCGRKKSYFPLAPFGMGYQDYINSDYMKITEEFINEISSHKFDADFYAYKAKKSYFNYVIDRCCQGVEIKSKGKLKIHKKRYVYYAHPRKEEFYRAVRRYFQRLFENQCSSEKIKLVFLDQAVHPRDSQKINDYFENGKMIIVDRDPRDIFADTIKSAAVSYENSVEEGKRFVQMQKDTHENIKNCDYVLRIRFEDLILKYDDTVRVIEEFCGLNPQQHTAKLKHLKPEISSKNIGIWKNYSSEYNEVFNVISEELTDFLYE